MVREYEAKWRTEKRTTGTRTRVMGPVKMKMMVKKR